MKKLILQTCEFLKNHPSTWKVLIAYLFFPILLNLVFLFPIIPTGFGLGNSEWLAFWGTYLGSGFGIFP